MRKKNLAAFKKEEAAEQELVAELTAEERFAKLTELLSKSKFYAKFLYDKLQQEDEETKRIKADKLKERRSLTENSDSMKSGSLKRTRLSVGNDVTKKAKLSPRMFNDEPIAEEQPLLISGGVMRGYQIEGYQWMANLYENGINGILADEMGLGKTIQTIALFAHLVEMGVSGPFLIIAPLSTITNWIKEFKKFAPLLPAVLYHGNAKEREDLRGLHLAEVHKIREGFNNPRTARNIFVTSYEIAMNDRVHFRKINWRYIVVDEGHRLKNTNCRLIKELRLYTSANRLLLTGTPLQNNLDELWSLLNFLMAEIFDDLRVFKSWFNAKDMDVEGEDEKKRILQQERQGSILSTLHQILTPFLLRRVKADVDLKIPPKKEVLVYCPMTEVQRVFYEATVNQTISAIVKPAQTEEAAPDLDSNGRPIRSCPKFDYKVSLI
jgi:ATP-dependent DNA helicase